MTTTNGAAVENGFILRTSVSALTAFDPASYAGCPRRWYFTRVLKVAEEETVAQSGGKDAHKQLEHYLGTGEDVLGPVASAGKHLLPAPGSDLHLEARFGNLSEAIALRQKTPGDFAAVTKVAGLAANGIPFDGYIDLRHGRGEYVDGQGVVRKEEARYGSVVEVVDHKTTSSIEKFAKSPSEMASTIQMVGYANYVLNVIPHVDTVRLSHIYYQTRGARDAKKVTMLISATYAREAWKRVDQVAAYMEEVAKAKRVEDVEPNTKSCDAYRGCPHVSRCPITRTLGTGGTMSLFNKPANGTTKPNTLFGVAPAPTPVSAPAEDRKTIDAEKTRLAAEDSPKCLSCGEVLTSLNVSKLQDGTVKHVGCVALGVSPPDAPKTSWLSSAKPMEKEQIVKIEDAEVKKRAEEHATVVAASAPVVEAPTVVEEKGGRCKSGGERVLMNQKQTLTRQMKCPSCDREWKAKDKDITIENDGVFFIVPKHNRDVSAPAVAPVVAAFLVADRVEAIADNRGESEMSAAAVNLANDLRTEQGVVLFVDLLVERGLQPLPLEQWYEPLIRELETQACLPDLRQANDKHDLAYGRWKGALAAAVRAVPPPPGTYVIHGINGSEIKQVVVEALSPLCTTVLRGVR